jgi:hypothetical protein
VEQLRRFAVPWDLSKVARINALERKDIQMKTKTKQGSGTRGNGNSKKANTSSDRSSTKGTKGSSGTTRADYEDEDAAIDRAAK